MNPESKYRDASTKIQGDSKNSVAVNDNLITIDGEVLSPNRYPQLYPGIYREIAKPENIVLPRHERKKRFNLLTEDELEHLPDPLWSIDGVLQENTLAVVYGEDGSKKSFLGIDWANSVATGLPWFGRSVKEGATVYISAEGVSGLKLRNKAWREEHRVIPKRRLIQPGPVNISDPQEVTAFIREVRAKGSAPRLVIIDTLARNIGSGKDVNKDVDVYAFVAGCDTIRTAFPGCSVVVVHHVGKDAKRGAKGSTAIEDAADTVLHVVSAKHSKTGSITVTKQKDSEAGLVIRFRLEPKGRSAVLLPQSGGQEPTAKPELPSDKAIRQALEKAPGGLRNAELQRTAHLPARTLNNRLKAMMSKGAIEKDGKTGHYRLTATIASGSAT